MTTAFLARKLMSTNLDEISIKNIKSLRTTYEHETHRTVRVLQRILTKKSLPQTCRLCLHDGERKIFSTYKDRDLSQDIEYALGIQVRESDGKPHNICNTCLELLEQAVQLKMTAEATQWQLQMEAKLVTEAKTEEMKQDELYPEPKEQLHGGYFTMNTNKTSIQRKWNCAKCRKSYNSLKEFSEHDCRRRRMASSLERFICEFCGKSFLNNMLLNRHRMVHTGEPGRFKCKFCTYHAYYKHLISEHERRHTGERPLQCSVCTKTFTRPSNLWTHQKTHLPPNYHCEFCPRSFIRKLSLRDHIASQHGSCKIWCCTLCGQTFTIRKGLLRHERLVHKRPSMKTNYAPIRTNSE